METSELRERVRAWLIDAKFGLLSNAKLVTLADQAIAEIDHPPDYLIAVSLREPLHGESRLDLVMDPIDSDDLIRLAVRLLAKLESGNIDIEKIVEIAEQVVCRHKVTEKDRRIWLECINITDALYRWGRAEAYAQVNNSLYALANLSLSD